VAIASFSVHVALTLNTTWVKGFSSLSLDHLSHHQE